MQGRYIERVGVGLQDKTLEMLKPSSDRDLLLGRPLLRFAIAG